ncbi:MAG: GxxExxY protein [Bacteroidota bacterium]
MEEDFITERILKCSFKVHTELGPGLLEAAYENCLNYEMTQEGLFVEKQKPMPLIYADVKMDCGYRLDFLVEKKVVVEVKTVEAFDEVHLAQVITYLKLSKCRIGLLLNFHVKSLKDGIKRVIV